jgi:hypothetical protein
VSNVTSNDDNESRLAHLTMLENARLTKLWSRVNEVSSLSARNAAQHTRERRLTTDAEATAFRRQADDTIRSIEHYAREGRWKPLSYLGKELHLDIWAKVVSSSFF